MPTYEYECAKCGRFDLFQRITEKAKTRCPKCKGKVKRLMGTGAGLIFKGSGFYITDYRSDNYKKAAKSESASPAASSAASESKSPASASSTESKSSAAKPSAPKETPAKK